MQQWEYMIVKCDSDKVLTVNGDKVGRVGFASITGELIWDFLNRRGSEGWEVVTVSTGQSSNSPIYTLKRLISQETSL